MRRKGKEKGRKGEEKGRIGKGEREEKKRKGKKKREEKRKGREGKERGKGGSVAVSRPGRRRTGTALQEEGFLLPWLFYAEGPCNGLRVLFGFPGKFVCCVVCL